MMTPKELLSIVSVAGKLKETTRHCYITESRKESVADHCWRIALMAMLLEGEFPEADMNKVIRMCLIHDLGEAFTGDIPTFMKTTGDEMKEENLLEEWVETFPTGTGKEWFALYEEMNALETIEAKIYKALDKMEAVISHNESDISTWLPLEYDLQFQYGKENVEFSSYFKELKAEIDKITEQKIQDKGE